MNPLLSQKEPRAFQALEDVHLFSEDNLNEYAIATLAAQEHVIDFLRQNKKPFSGVSFAELKPFFADINLCSPSSYEEVFEEVKTLYTQHAVNFHLPKYVAHLNCPIVVPALAAEILVSAINSSLDTWDQSAGGTLIEQKLVRWTCDEIGFDQNADGVFTSGGSQSNLMGLLLARDHFCVEHLRHNIKQAGLPAEASKFRILVSEKAHFSIQKNASILGLGENAVVKIKTDCFFRMNPVLLEDTIQDILQEGNIPIAIVATAGTTDFGSVDPLNEIAEISKKHNLWLHVDAAYGCGLLLSDKHRYLLNGIEKASSVTADYHKSFFQPVSSSGFFVRDKKHFKLITHYADYLNPKESVSEETQNQVDKSIQTTRRFDALKLWFTLRVMGKKQLGNYIDKIISTTKEVIELIEEDPCFELLNHSDISALVFRYDANRFQSSNLNNVNQYIKSALYKNGEALVAGTKVNNEFYLKFTILNPLTTIEDIKDILNLIKKHGNDYVELN